MAKLFVCDSLTYGDMPSATLMTKAGTGDNADSANWHLGGASFTRCQAIYD
ncbi:MAG: hypothetical protein ACK6DS_19825 [Planctomycetota bacterium]|jgi:hypothetical protein